jgi:hypothetical protein
MLEQLKRLAVDVVPLEELVASEVFASGLKARYEELEIETPAWIKDKLRQIRRSIEAKLDETRALRARELEKQLEGLKTPTERRAEIEKQLKALRPHLAEVE